MNCRQIRFLSIDYLEGSLPTNDRQAFEEHLALCTECREYIEQERKLSHILEQAPSGPDPGDLYWKTLDSAILARTLKSGDSRTENSGYRPRRRTEIIGRYLLPMAAAIILIIIPLALINNGTFVGKTSGTADRSYDPLLIGEYSVDIEIPAEAKNEESSNMIISMALSAPGLAGRNLAVLERMNQLSWGAQ